MAMRCKEALKCVSLRSLGDACWFQGHIDHHRDDEKTAAKLLPFPGMKPCPRCLFLSGMTRWTWAHDLDPHGLTLEWDLILRLALL